MSHGFLHLSLVFLGAAVLFVPIFQRLGLGSVLGYLIAGIVIGPGALGLVVDVDEILHFSEFGVVLLLFLIGLELEPRRLWKLRVPIFGTGGLQVLGSGLIVALSFKAIGWDWSASAVVGMGFSLSSTAIAVQVMKERAWLETTGGSSAFSVLLFQDLAVIPMLAVLPLIATTATSEAAPLTFLGVLKVLGIFVGLIVFARFGLRPLLRLVAGSHLREVFTALALFLVVGMSALMTSLGLSMGLGAFMAGVMLANSEYRHALETDLEPFKGLLLGLFFISVGMSVNLDVVADSPWQVLGMAMFATLVKLIYQRGLAHVFVLPRSQSWGFSAVLSQVGEFAFVLFGAAAALGILSPTQSGQLIAATALTMLLSPLVLILQAKWDARSGSVKPPEDKIENEHPEVMIAGFGRFGQIVGRLLFARGLRATVVDHEPDQIELLRQFGFKVYYGDATRLELLEAAGLREAKVLVVAIDDPAEALKLVDLVQKEFPEVKIYSRARNLRHLYDLMDRKLAGIERETFEASLSLGRKVLVGLGVNPHEAWQATNQFRRHNYDMIEDLHQLRNDRELMVAKAKQSRADLEQMFQRDQSSLQNPDAHW
jgi:glutathione-regulated potassium-efflux system ancillary protein KefC